MAKIDLKNLIKNIKNLKNYSKEDWKYFFLSNIDMIFIIGEIIILLFILNLKSKEAKIRYDIPNIPLTSQVEKIFPNKEYNEFLDMINFDFVKSDFNELGTKNIFDYKFVKNPEKLKEEVIRLETEAKSLFDQGKYDEALSKINEVLLRNPYRESAIKLKKQIEELKQKSSKK